MTFNFKHFFTPLSLLAVLTLNSCSQNLSGNFNIEFYSQGDIHGRFFDSLYVGNKEHKSSMANLSGFIKERRSEVGAENIILIDNGDHLQGDNSTYYFNFVDTLSANDPTKHFFSRVMNYVGFDAAVVGNHDIEAGHNIYDRVKRELNMPYLAANAIKTDGSGECYFEPYTIINKSGVKVAVIGMTTPFIPKWLAPELFSGMEFRDILQMADSVVAAVIERENPHIVALAVHAGVGEIDSYNPDAPAKYLAANLQNVDIVVAAHDHKVECSKVWNGKDSLLVLDGGARGEFLTKAQIEISLDRGKVVSKNISGEIIKLSKAAKDSDYLLEFKEDFNKVKAFTNKKVGHINEDIHTIDAFFGASKYMSLIHYVQLAESGADISFSAPLTSNGVVKAGDLNYQDMFTIYPYENQLYTINLTGAQVKDYLEFSYDMWINTIKEPGDHILKIAFDKDSNRYRFVNMSFNFDSGAGLDYTVDVTKPYGSRVNITNVYGLDKSNKKPFSLKENYSVALSSYRANGGGDLLQLGAKVNADSEIITGKYKEIRELIYEYFKSGKLNTLPNDNNWMFIPSYKTKSIIDRDKKLLSR